MSDKSLHNWLKKQSGDDLPAKLSADEKAELARYDRIWEAAAPRASKLDVDTDAAWSKVDDRLFGDEKVVPIGRKNQRWKLLRIAAAVLVLIVAGFLIRGFFTTPTDVEAMNFASTDMPKEFMLPDGTQIYLNKNSQLAYVEDETTRMVTLTGEAFFDVARNEGQPFSITTGDLITTVLGTSFNIRAYPDEVREVSVKTGKVSVSAVDQEVVLTPSEKVVYEPKAKKLSKKQVAVVDAEVWRTKALTFDKVKLSNIIPVLERFYGREIRLENEALQNCLFNGDFKEEELSVILEDMQFVFGVEVEQNEDRILIKGGSCE